MVVWIVLQQGRIVAVYDTLDKAMLNYGQDKDAVIIEQYVID